MNNKYIDIYNDIFTALDTQDLIIKESFLMKSIDIDDVKKNLTATVKTLKAIDTKLFEGIDSKNWGSGGRNEVRRNAIRRKTKRPNEIRRSHIKSKKRTSLKNRRH